MGALRVKDPTLREERILEPVVGIEPTTYGLRMQSEVFLEMCKKCRKCPSNGLFVSVLLIRPKRS